jgi:hypothetical protein
VIRSKKSRSLDSIGGDGKKDKLINSKFTNKNTIAFQQTRFKKKLIQDGKLLVEWGDYKGIMAVKVSVLDRNGNNIFDNSMLLLTNKVVTDLESAHAIHQAYLKRSTIEYVFKFLKEGIGWEDLQIRHFKGIQNLLSLCFYMSAYLYEIGEEKAYDDYAILLADLGGGKEKVTRHFIFEGIKALMTKYRVDRILTRREVSKYYEEGLRAMGDSDYEIIRK